MGQIAPALPLWCPRWPPPPPTPSWAPVTAISPPPSTTLHSAASPTGKPSDTYTAQSWSDWADVVCGGGKDGAGGSWTRWTAELKMLQKNEVGMDVSAQNATEKRSRGVGGGGGSPTQNIAEKSNSGQTSMGCIKRQWKPENWTVQLKALHLTAQQVQQVSSVTPTSPLKRTENNNAARSELNLASWC